MKLLRKFLYFFLDFPSGWFIIGISIRNYWLIGLTRRKEMTKHVLSVLLILALLALPVFASGAKEDTSSAQAVEEKTMTHDELVAAAQAEGTLTVYTYSSRTTKIGDAFTEKYGIKVDVTQLKDTEMIEKVSKEAAADLDAADVVFCQDGSRIYPELIMTGYVTTYIPENVEGNLLDEEFENPLVFEAMNKVFIYNSEVSPEQKLTNIWQLTEPEYKGALQFKDPFSEAVNMNFFTMITREDWAEKIAEAYKNYYGKEIELTTKNAGYEWIKAIYNNGAVLGKSDTTIAENVGAKGQNKEMVGLFTLNKMRTAKDKDLALSPAYDMEPFSGFMYPAYVFITANAKASNAAKLFIEFAFSEEGWKPFDVIGDYSPVTYLSDNSEDELNVLDWKSQLVYEDYEWCAEARADVEEFISSII